MALAVQMLLSWNLTMNSREVDQLHAIASEVEALLHMGKVGKARAVLSVQCLVPAMGSRIQGLVHVKARVALWNAWLHVAARSDMSWRRGHHRATDVGRTLALAVKLRLYRLQIFGHPAL